jgi:hypothetical protein
MGVWSRVLATEPTPPSSSPSQTAQSPTNQQSAAAPAGKPNAASPQSEHDAAPPTAESSPAKPGAADAGKAEQPLEDRELISHGYKLRMHNGEKWFCRREEELGSRLGGKMQCNTAAEIQAQRLAAQDAVRQMQTNKPGMGN